MSCCAHDFPRRSRVSRLCVFISNVFVSRRKNQLAIIILFFSSSQDLPCNTTSNLLVPYVKTGRFFHRSFISVNNAYGRFRAARLV
ncbi:unnamed protein product [Periconia digitata]|uniref:Uncharacterized protein n=1 Tax=Periconia digitata TaxID=1303443 RepID=A0A9W4UH95_9PLEO|nr:unnamed protein product [Periconia digitata]